MKLRIFGSRGSAVFSRNTSYGGNTTCMVLESKDNMIVLDAGSGLMGVDMDLRERYPGYPNSLPFEATVLISHLHLDHVIGLPWFAPFFSPKVKSKIYTYDRGGGALRDQIFGSFVPPYWPVSMAAISSVECLPIDGPFETNGFTVTPFVANHPDKTASFHITDGKKTLVYLLDNEMQPGYDRTEIIERCRNADLVVFDAAYLIEDYPGKIGWGHATVEDGIQLAEASGLKRMVFSHYAQEYPDHKLNLLNERVPDDGRFIFAREGMTIEL